MICIIPFHITRKPILTQFCVNLGIQIPHIVAGDNLDMPMIGKLLKSSGAVYIRREWGDDLLYKTILDEYMATLLSEGSKFRCCPYFHVV